MSPVQIPLWNEDDFSPSSSGDLIMEITSPSNLSRYNPVEDSTLRSILELTVMPVEIGDYSTKVMNEFKQAVRSSLRSDTAVIFPAYFSSKAGSPKSRYPRKHISLFSNLLSSMRNREGERPRMLCLNDLHPEHRDNMTGRWLRNKSDASNENRESKYEKKVNDYLSGTSIPATAIPLDDEEIKASHMPVIISSVRKWLADNPEVTNLVFTSPEFAGQLFKTSPLPSSLGEAAYRTYDAELLLKIDGAAVTRRYRVGFIPSLLNLIKFEDRGLDITADMLSVLMNPGKQEPVKRKIIRTPAQASKIVKYCIKHGTPLSLDIETTGLNPVFPKQSIISASVSNGEWSAAFLVDHPRYPQHKGLDILKVFFMAEGLTLVLQNAAFDIKWFKFFTGLYPAARLYDTMLLDHWLFEGQGSVSKFLGLGFGYSMDVQIPRYLRVSSHKPMLEKALAEAEVRNPFSFPKEAELSALTVKDLQDILAKMHSPEWLEPNSGRYAGIDLNLLLRYNQDDAAATLRIFNRQCSMIDAQCGGRRNWPEVLNGLMPKLIHNAVEMELNGAPVDYDEILDKVRVVSVEMDQCRGAVESATSASFNIDSAPQLIDHLTRVCKVHRDELWSVKKGKISTEVEILSRLVDRIPWMNDLLSYKKAAKLKCTYLIPILFKSYKGVLYFGINLTGTVTGRLSSRNPNIQNLPSSLTVSGRKIGLKEVIQAKSGRILADMDLSSAEVKVLTVPCPDPTLINVLKQGMDSHCYTASIVSQKTSHPVSYEAMYTAHMKKEGKIKEPMTALEKEYVKARKNAKKVTFGSIYRIGKQGLAPQLEFPFTPPEGLTYKQVLEKRQAEGEVFAAELLSQLFTEIYPTLPKVFRRSDIQVFNRHYGESIFGRRRRYVYTLVPLVHRILTGAGLYSETGRSIFDIDDCLRFIPSKRCFRQNVNFEVQSPTSDYMQYYIYYISTEGRKAGIDQIFHFTVHDSAVFSFSETPENASAFEAVCNKGMSEYLMSLSDKLPVVIGYGMAMSRKYNPV